MNKTLACVFVVACLLSAPRVDAQESLPHAVLVDGYMSPHAGAAGLLTVQHAIALAEDRWLPRTIGREDTRPGLAFGILYRSAKFLALDVPQDHMLMVIAHEVFGHGARFRELGRGTIGYGFDPPIPYGSGEAFTRFSGEFPATPLALLNVSASGIEAQNALADAILERAAAGGRLHYREAWLYFESRVAGMGYILSASPTSSPGHDVADFLDTFVEACTAPCVPLTRKYVQRRALLTLADPLLYYSVYGFAVGYIGQGRTASGVPMMPLGGATRVLPSVGYALAPYGTEWTTRAEFASAANNMRLAGVAVRIGNTGASTPWGVTARARDLLRWRGMRIDAAVNLWRQPPPFADQTSASLKTGAGALATIVLPLPRAVRSRWSDGLHITAGYKSDGYVPGEQITRGPVLRVGMQIR